MCRLRAPLAVSRRDQPPHPPLDLGMSRRQRQFARHVGRPADHQPHRPGWWCARCGADWPCVTLRRHLLDTLDRSAISSLMAGWAPQMLAELREEAVVHERLYAWHLHPVGRPAGGPL